MSLAPMRVSCRQRAEAYWHARGKRNACLGVRRSPNKNWLCSRPSLGLESNGVSHRLRCDDGRIAYSGAYLLSARMRPNRPNGARSISIVMTFSSISEANESAAGGNGSSNNILSYIVAKYGTGVARRRGVARPRFEAWRRGGVNVVAYAWRRGRKLA